MRNRLSPAPEQQQEAPATPRDQRLSADERNELKRLWRQVSRLRCHPDVVADELKENQMMVQLNQARQNADSGNSRVIDAAAAVWNR